jgi:hypothetical protein
MRKLLLCAVGAALITAVAGAGSAEAKCGNACLKKKLNRLTTQVTQLQQTVSQQSQAITASNQALKNVTDCLGEAPLTQYGDPAGTLGYQFDNDAIGSGDDPFLTTALDVTEGGDPIDGWALFDACNTVSVASASASRSALAPNVAAQMFSGAQHHNP